MHGTRPAPPYPHYRLLLCMAVLWVALACVAASPVSGRCGGTLDEMTWLTEEYYPYNYREDGRVKGISADLLRLVWQEMGEPEHSIYVLPWARAYVQTQGTKNTVLFSMARTPEREKLFKWAGPIAHVRFVLAARKGSRITMDSMEDLAGLRVGTLRGDVSDQLLQPFKDKCRVDAVVRMDQNLRKLDAGRIDLVAYEELSLRLLLQHDGRPPDALQTVYVLREVPVYYAFNLATDNALIQRFQSALNDAKNTEAYARLLNGYIQ